MMNNTHILAILNIVKRSQKRVQRALNSTVNHRYNTGTLVERIHELKELLQILEQTIITESYVFNIEFDNESEMLEAIESFFISIHNSLDEIIEMYYDFKANAHESNTYMSSMKIVEKILLEYLFFMNQLESAILGTGEDSLTFEPNIDNEIEAFLKNSKNHNNEKSLLLPILTAFGLGFLLGS